MGTSQSSRGPGGNSPLVPPWADAQPQEPLPLPDPNRFRPFRQAIGQFVKSGSATDLRSALGHYATRATGGSTIAARRMGSVTKAGAALFGALTGSRDSITPSESKIDINSLAGLPCDVALDMLTRSLSTEDGDGDKIRTAMNSALTEALDGVIVFNPLHITDDIIIDTMINYLAESVFLQITLDAGKAWTKAETPIQSVNAENALRELTKVVVDKHMAPKLAGNIRTISPSEMRELQTQVVRAVWNEWEQYQ